MNRTANVLVAMLALVLFVGFAMPLLAANEDKTEGTIKSITVNKSEFVLTDNDNKNWTMYLDTKAKVFINDKAAEFSELKATDHVFGHVPETRRQAHGHEDQLQTEITLRRPSPAASHKTGDGRPRSAVPRSFTQSFPVLPRHFISHGRVHRFLEHLA